MKEGEHNWLNVTDLEPGATYEIVVVAVNGNGDETESAPKDITIGPTEGTVSTHFY